MSDESRAPTPEATKRTRVLPIVIVAAALLALLGIGVFATLAQRSPRPAEFRVALRIDEAGGATSLLVDGTAVGDLDLPATEERLRELARAAVEHGGGSNAATRSVVEADMRVPLEQVRRTMDLLNEEGFATPAFDCRTR